MSVTVTFRGTEKLLKLYDDLNDDLRKKLQTATRRATRTVIDDELPPVVRANAAISWPKRHFAEVNPELRFRTIVRLSSQTGTWVSVTVWARGKARHRDLKILDDLGQLRHPLFGYRLRWYATQVKPGFATLALHSIRPVLVKRIDAAWEQVAVEFEATH